jgi:hypothetical protein
MLKLINVSEVRTASIIRAISLMFVDFTSVPRCVWKLSTLMYMSSCGAWPAPGYTAASNNRGFDAALLYVAAIRFCCEEFSAVLSRLAEEICSSKNAKK